MYSTSCTETLSKQQVNATKNKHKSETDEMNNTADEKN